MTLDNLNWALFIFDVFLAGVALGVVVMMMLVTYIIRQPLGEQDE